MVDRPTDADPRSNDGGSAGPSKKGEETALTARLERLGETLEARKAAEEAAKSKGKPSGFAQATKIASEFVAGVIVGAAVGWGIDNALGTFPWALIVFLLLGFAAGVLNVLRSEGMVADPTARLREAAKKDTRPDR